jgi:UDP-N-acetylmuramyl pentapeptide synthase
MIAVLGEMRELGDTAITAHRDTGSTASDAERPAQERGLF